MKPRLRFEPPPAQPPPPEQCAFYHSIEVPGYEPFGGSWRIARPLEYLGAVPLAGRRVLDVGTASGLLAFTAERLGAREVVALDLPPEADYDARLPVGEVARKHHRARRALIRNGFWLCHSALGSRVRLVHADVRRLPEGLGRFDVVILGNVLQHLRDPLGAVLNLAEHAGVLVVAEACWLPLAPESNPLTLTMFGSDHPYSWFQARPELLEALLAPRGFGRRTVTWHTQEFLRVSEYPADGSVREVAQGVEIPHFTLVATRD